MVGTLRRSPRQGRSGETVERILSAAAELLEEGGPEKATIAAIAVRADVQPGSIYHFFANREAILGAIAGRLYDEVDRTILSQLPQYLECLPWEQAVGRLLDTAYDAYLEHPTYRKLFLGGLRRSESFDEIRIKSDTELAYSLSGYLTAWGVAETDVLVVSGTVVRIANKLLDWCLETEDESQRRAIRREAKRAVCAYLASYIGPDPPVWCKNSIGEN